MRDVDDDLRVANVLADAARSVIRPYFRSPSLNIDNKHEDGFDPVTQADKSAEYVMREILALERPSDGILGEEYGPHEGSSGYTWVLDPIDGTRAFLCGSPTWGVLIALNAGGKPHLGILDQPFTQERFIGVAGQPATWIRTLGYNDIQRQTLTTRACSALEDAVLLTTFPEIGTPDEAQAFARIKDQARLTRYGLDCYAYGLLAMGHVDLVMEAGLQPYDIQALIPIVESAGGCVTDWQGGDCYNDGQVLACGDKDLHHAVIELL